MNKSEQLIACLEGEIAKRDETIARLEPQLNRAIQANYDLRAELAAIKAQEPVAFVHPEQLKVLSAESSATCAVWNKPGAMPSGTSLRVPLYAAPVSEAEAQAVVMPERSAFEEWMLSFEHPVLGWLERESFTFGVDQSTYFDEYIQGAWVACSRLNAATVQQVSVPQCVFDWFEAKQAHVNAVDAYNARLAFVREHMPFGTSVDPEYQIMEAAERKARNLVGPMFNGLRDLAAAPAAPAADAGVTTHETPSTTCRASCWSAYLMLAGAAKP